MALLQNDREKVLDATSVRITSGSISLAFTGQYFTADTLGVITPNSITITATPSVTYTTQGVAPTYSWHYCLDTDPTVEGNWTLIGGATANTLVLTKENFSSYRGSSSFIRVRCTVAKEGMNTSSSFTTIGLIDNSAGSSGIVNTLTNNSVLVSAGSDGTGYSLTGAGGTYQLRVGSSSASGQAYSIVGGTDLGSTWSQTKNGLTMTINETTGVYSLSGGTWTSDREEFTLRVTYEAVNYDIVYNIAKVKQGLSGDGIQGDSARRAYTVSTLAELGSGTVVVSLPNTLPPTNSAFGNGLTWTATPPSSLTVGQRLFQSDGIFNPGTGNTTYTTPYLSSLKVGSLEAIVANTGALNVTGNLTLGTLGKIFSTGKSSYASATPGFFLGYDTDNYKLSIGSGTDSLTWDGTTLSYPASKLTGSIVNSQIASGLDASKLTTGTLPIDRIASEAINATKFASTIKPIEIVSSLPGAPHVAGRVVFLTTDSKLYRNNGSTWVKEIDGADVTTGINASNITSGTLPAARIASGALDATKFASTIKPVEIVSGLPPPPHVAGRVIFNTEDSKLYRNTGAGWTSTVLAEDVQGQFSSNQINIGIGGGNLLYNSRFTADINNNNIPDGWETLIVGTGVTATRAIGTDSVDGSKYLEVNISNLVVPTSTTNHEVLVNLDTNIMPTVIAGEKYTFSVYAITNNLNYSALCRVSWYGTGSIDLGITNSFVVGAFSSTGVWERFSGTLTAPAGAVYARIRVGIRRSSTSDTALGYIRFKWPQLENSDYVSSYAPRPSELLPGSIGTTEIKDDAITSAKVVAGAIVAGKLATSSVSTDNLISGSVTAAKLYSGAIEADKIQAANLAAGSVTAGKIAAGAVTATEIQANAITASRLTLSDTSNIVPDNDMLDTQSWSGATALVSSPTTDWVSGNIARLDGLGTNFVFLYSNLFTVEPGASYYFSFQGQILSGSGTVFGQLQFSSSTNFSSPTNSAFNSIGTTSVSSNTTIITVPSNVRYARVRAYKNNNGVTSCYVGGFVLRRAASAELIVDGAITANKIQAGAVTTSSMTADSINGDRIATETLSANKLVANSITSGQIAAGAISTDQLAAGAVSATKLFVGDTSNLFPDYDTLDPNFYSGNGSYSIVGSAYTATGRNRVSIPANASEVQVTTLYFQCEPSTDYFIEGHVSRSTGTTGTGDIVLRQASLNSSGVITFLSNTTIANNISSTDSTLRYGLAITTASNCRRLSIMYRRDAGGDGTLEFGGIVIRRRANGNLIVDGSVTADKIAAGSITATKLFIGDTSNVYPDFDMFDPNFYIGAAHTFVDTSYSVTGQRRLRIDANVAEQTVTTAWFQCEPSTEYYAEAAIFREDGTSGTGDILVNMGSLAANGAVTWVANAVVANNISTTTPGRYGMSFTTDATTRRMMVVFRRDAGGDGRLTFGGVVIRRRANGNLIVDGSITATKLSVTNLAAVSASTGSLTVDNSLIINTAGNIRGGATSFLAGNGFWQGYDSTSYKWRVGTANGARAEWNGTKFSIYNSSNVEVFSSGGTISATQITGTLNASQINANGLSIKNALGAPLLVATGGSTPPWVVALESSSDGVSLVSSTNNENNTAVIKALKAGDGIEIKEIGSSVVQVSSKSGTDSITLNSDRSYTNVMGSGSNQVEGFYLPLETNSIYVLEGYIRVRTSELNTGVSIGIEVPFNATSGGANTVFRANASIASNSTETRMAHSTNGGGLFVTFSANYAATNTAPNTYNAASFGLIHMYATITTGSVAGKVQVIAGTEVSGNQIVIGAGSSLLLHKITNITASTSSTGLSSSPAGIATTYSASVINDGTSATAVTTFVVNTNGTWSLNRIGGTNTSGTWLASGTADQWDVLFDVTGTTGTSNITRSNGASSYTQVLTNLSYSISAFSVANSNTTRSGSSTIAIRFRNRNNGSITTIQTTTLSVSARSDYLGGVIP